MKLFGKYLPTYIYCRDHTGNLDMYWSACLKSINIYFDHKNFVIIYLNSNVFLNS